MIAPCDPAEPAVGAFAADESGERWTYAGAMTFDNAAHVLAQAQRLPLPSSGTVDLSGLFAADSAAIAVLLALARRARGEGAKLAFTALPESVVALARVYGVDDLIGA